MCDFVDVQNSSMCRSIEELIEIGEQHVYKCVVSSNQSKWDLRNSCLPLFFCLAMHGSRLCLWILSAQESPTNLSMAAKGAAMWPVWCMLSFKLLEERGQWQVPALWTDTGTYIKEVPSNFVGAAASKTKNLLLFSMYIVYNPVNLPKLLEKIYLMRKTLEVMLILHTN